MRTAIMLEGALLHLQLGTGGWVLDHPEHGRVGLRFPPGAAPARALSGRRARVSGWWEEGFGLVMAASRSLRVEALTPLG